MEEGDARLAAKAAGERVFRWCRISSARVLLRGIQKYASLLSCTGVTAITPGQSMRDRNAG